MSLKARIEAVIYAAEEPVTLPQLAAIFREEALASRAARLSVPAADPEQPTEADVVDEIAPAIEAAEPGADTNGEPSEPSSQEPPAEPAERPEDIPEEDRSQVPTESGAQNSSDAAVAVPDFAGEPQPYPNEPPEATTPDPPIPPDVPDDPWREPAFNAIEAPAESPEAEPSESPAEPQEETGPDEAPEQSAAHPPVLSPEDEKRLARQREREVREEIRRLVDELIAEYAASDRGVEIREIAGGFRMATRAEYHDAVRAFVRSLKPPMKLSLQALETLAVIAYKQPITAPEIAEVRGVDSGGVLGSLVARKLITTAGRKQVVGRPILYKTTKEFLLRFGLKDLSELPSLEEFEKMASELAEQEEPPAEQIPLAQNAAAAIEEEAETAEEAAERMADEDQSDARSSAGFGSPAAEPATPDSIVPAAEPEVGAAATEPVEAREEAAPQSHEPTEPEAAENPEPALAGAETNPELPAEEASHDGKPAPPPEPEPVHAGASPLSSEEGQS